MTERAGATPEPPDPAAVRVRLSGRSAAPGEDGHLRVAPVHARLEMTNPTIGVGALGGAALPDPRPAEDEAGVLAQRRACIDGVEEQVALRPLGAGRALLVEDGRATRLVLEAPTATRAGLVREVLVDGFRFEVEVEPERIAALRERAARGRTGAGHGGPLEIRAIIPGKVVALSVAPGDAVTAGQQLLVVEAMKMQNELRAPRDGTIDRVGVRHGASIEVGDLLVVIS